MILILFEKMLISIKRIKESVDINQDGYLCKVCI